MPANYLKVQIGDFEIQVEKAEDLPVSLNYSLEDTEDFQSKTSSNALNLKIPATLLNDKAANTFHNPDAEDMTDSQVFKGFQPCVIEANGNELLTGKAILTSGSHTDRPNVYNFDLYGNNADWMIDLAEKTLYDFLSHISYPFTVDNITASWVFDGTDESLPYVLAPVRYGQPMEAGYSNLVMVDPPFIQDYNMMPDYIKPSISKYFIIYWAFKSFGYKVKSQFLDTSYFRRQVMPWTWGSYLTSEGTVLDALKFSAQSTGDVSFSGVINDYVDLKVSNDYYNGGFDNSNTYEYDDVAKEMQWTYPSSSDHGALTASFSLNLTVKADLGGFGHMYISVEWYKNGTHITRTSDEIFHHDFIGNIIESLSDSMDIAVEHGDVVVAKVHIDADNPTSNPDVFNITSFKLNYFRKELGGTIYFNEYLGFKKYKFLDFLRGVVDEFNLSVQTDSINKVVYIEPTHPYSLTNDLSIRTGGYFNEDFIDWSSKQDISKESVLNNFSDGERELIFKYKDDGSDGIAKKVKDRIVSYIPLGSCKYVLPSRFKKGNKAIENRFFSAVMHYEVSQWKDITDTAPQMICVIPENISNTSRDEAQNTFAPKSCYYKGNISGVGGWKFNNVNHSSFPFMFAVNYKPGGENDPILSYCDERIGVEGSYVTGKGLVRRFFLQRMAIMRNGQYYNTFFRLNNNDITNFLHREHIVCGLQRWELVQINGYKPLKDDSTPVFMRKYTPVSKTDSDNVFPRSETILTNQPSTAPFEVRYSPRMCMPTDI